MTEKAKAWWSEDGKWFCLLVNDGVNQATVSLTPDEAASLRSALTTVSVPAAQAGGVEGEIEQLRRGQELAVMPLIGPLLDQWEGMSNDAKSTLRWENPSLCEFLDKINEAMDAPPAPRGDRG